MRRGRPKTYNTYVIIEEVDNVDIAQKDGTKHVFLVDADDWNELKDKKWYINNGYVYSKTSPNKDLLKGIAIHQYVMSTVGDNTGTSVPKK